MAWEISPRVGVTESFPNPFSDIAGMAMPETLKSALHWCEYLYTVFGTYRSAMERVVSYFLTDIEIGGDDVSDEEREKYENFLNNTLDARTVLQNLLRDRMCFHGDVKAVTRDGVFKLRDLAGKTVDVLSQDGIYRPATFKSFGQQRLWEVEFSDGRMVLATAEHQWITKDLTRLPTTKLGPGCYVPRVVASRPPRNKEFFEGVRHGFTFANGFDCGSIGLAMVYFFADRDEPMLSYFSDIDVSQSTLTENRMKVINGLPSHYKALPLNEFSASYWYGFVCGVLAAVGFVDANGSFVLTQRSHTNLELIIQQLPRIGMVAGPIQSYLPSYWRGVSKLAQRYINGEILYGARIPSDCLLPQDILLVEDREKFVDNVIARDSAKWLAVRSVRPTGIVDEVFCCVEDQTHSFVVEQGILTGNCYGNAFVSLIVPFKRFLLCRTDSCGALFPLQEVYNNKQFGFEWSDFQFKAKCPRCNRRGAWKVVDKPDNEEQKLKLKRWNPHEIELLHDPYTDDVSYFWHIPEDYKKLIRDGNLFHLERASERVLAAVQRNQLFRFNADAIFHMKEPTLAGIRNRGWGVPRLLANFRQVYYIQVLRRFNEAIALDYVIPFRLLTPAPRPGGSVGGMPLTDPLMTFNGSDFRSQVLSMIRRRRHDPASWHVLPFPVQYQILGGEARALAPQDLINQGLESLLNDAGVPVELYRGSLQLQSAPTALRLFEATWHHLVHETNSFLQWLVNQISQIMSWETVKARLKRVTIADDINKQMASLQLMLGQQISGRTALGGFGFDWDTEQKRLAEEARKQMETQSRLQEDMMRAGFAQQMARGQMGGGQGQQPGGGQPIQAQAQPVTSYIQSMGPNVPVTPNDLVAVAEQLAQELLGLPESIKDSELRRLKQYNPVLHAQVKEKMNALRQHFRMRGGQQLLEQHFGRRHG